MKKLLFILSIIMVCTITINAQETEQVMDSVATVQQETGKQALSETEEKTKAIAKAEKARKKAEKAQKKTEKALKKQEKRAKAITAKQKAIQKGEAKIKKLERKLAKGKSKGQIAPADEMKINQKIDKLELEMVKDKAKLAKLQQKL